MKILLDIDDTALITKDKGKTWNEHPKLAKLISEHNVFLFSGNPEIEKYAKQWKTNGYYFKGNNFIPQGDALIDNDWELWKDFVEVKYCFSSIDEFYEKMSK